MSANASTSSPGAGPLNRSLTADDAPGIIRSPRTLQLPVPIIPPSAVAGQGVERADMSLRSLGSLGDKDKDSRARLARVSAQLDPRLDRRRSNGSSKLEIMTAGSTSDAGRRKQVRYLSEEVTFADKSPTEGTPLQMGRGGRDEDDEEAEEAEDLGDLNQSRSRSRTVSGPVNLPGGEKVHGSSVFGDSTDHSTSAYDSALYGDAEPTMWDRFDRRVPFAVQVAVLMLIPIAFLVSFSVLNVNEAARSHAYLADHEPLLRSLGDLQHQVMLERGVSSQAIATQDLASFRVALDAARSKVDLYANHVLVLIGKVGDDLIQDDVWPELRDAMRQLALTRYQVDHLAIGGNIVRERLTDLTLVINEGRNALLSDTTVASPVKLLQLRTAWHEANYLGVCRAVGAHILAVRNATYVAWPLLAELRQARTQYFFHRMEYAQLTDPRYRMGAAVPRHVTPARREAEVVLDLLLADPLGYNRTTITQWFAIFTAAVDGQLNFVDLIDDMIAKDRSTIIAEVLKLIFAVIASCGCGAFIVFSQYRVSHRIQAALQCSRRTQKAVLAFVPKPFLRMSGCTNILQVTPGDHSEVAVAMLFSDIRSFTSISEGMMNDDLFEWLQRYFARTTVIVEHHGGFIDKFIGDAVFAVFPNVDNSVECGVAMQASTQQLNADIVAHGGEYLVAIGVGIHHAVVCVGFLGDSQRITCTMISSEVNLASRLEGLTKRYGAKILLTGAAYGLLNRSSICEDSRRMGDVVVKGATAHLEIHEVFTSDELPLKRHKAATKKRFEEAVLLRSQGHLAAGNEALQDVAKAAEEAGLQDIACHLKLEHTLAFDKHDTK